MDFFLGEIRLFPFAVIPRGWLECNGTELPIQGYQALFSLLSTRFGGNGTTTFALPDLRGRAPVGTTIPNTIGQKVGVESVTLTIDQTPQHSHNVLAYNGVGNMKSPTGAIPATSTKIQGPSSLPPAPNMYGSYVANGQTLAADAIGSTGGAPHENRQPSLALVYCIASTGVYPSHS